VDSAGNGGIIYEGVVKLGSLEIFLRPQNYYFGQQKASASVKHILLECYNLKNIRDR